MVNIIVMGHGGYAEGVRNNLEMVCGVPDYMHFVDFKQNEDISDFIQHINEAVEKCNDNDIIFACDLLGASPFKNAALICAAKPDRYYAVAGLNPMALMELAGDIDGTVKELVDRAVNTTKTTVAVFPATK